MSRPWLLVAWMTAGCGGAVPASSSAQRAQDPMLESTSGVGEPTDCDSLSPFLSRSAVRIDHFLLAHMCEHWGVAPSDGEPSERRDELIGLVQRLRSENRTASIPPDAARLLGLVPPRAGLRDVYVMRDSDRERILNQLDVEPYLGSGGVLGVLHFNGGLDGHYEVTAKAVDRLKSSQAPGFAQFSGAAVEVLQDASQDPDFYEWDSPEAHAQSPNDPAGRLVPGDWPAGWMKWTQAKFDSAKRAAEAGQFAHALYWVGYGLHSIEDLASHRGRSNAEHSCNERIGHSPDMETASIDYAVELASQVLEQLPARFGSSHWGGLAHYVGPSKLSSAEKTHLLQRGWDFGVGKAWTYRNLGKQFERLADRAEHQIRWCAPGRCAALMDQLLIGTAPGAPYLCNLSPGLRCGCQE
jgi:hypothetical protein